MRSQSFAVTFVRKRTARLPALVFLGVATIGLMSAGLSEAQSQFVIEPVDNGRGIPNASCDFASLAVGPTGLPCIGYSYMTPDANRALRAVRYATRSGAGWTIETVDQGYAANSVSVALDAEAEPNMAWSSASDAPLRLMYGHRTGGVWAIDTVVSRTLPWQGGFNSLSLVMDPTTDLPIIIYRDDEEQALKIARRVGSEWSIESIGPSTGAVSAKCDAGGKLHIAHVLYNDSLARYVGQYVRQTDIGWDPELLSSDPCAYASIALAPDGQPMASYINCDPSVPTPCRLSLATRSMTGWTTEPVQDQAASGPALTVDSQSVPHIAYGAGATIRHAVRRGAQWELTTVDSAQSGGPGDRVAIGLDAAERVHVAYTFVPATGDTTGGLYYAVQRATTGRVPPMGRPPRLSLIAVYPSPVRDRLNMILELPGDEPVRAEVFDVAGRCWTSRVMERLGAGRHSVELLQGQKLRSGLYFARLTQGAAAVTAEVVVLR